MATCPSCGVSSRSDPTAMKVERVLVNKPLGTWSLAGVQNKTVVVDRLQLSCRCGWSVIGYIEADYFVADQHVRQQVDSTGSDV